MSWKAASAAREPAISLVQFGTGEPQEHRRGMIAHTASHFAAAVRATENLTMEGSAPQFAADASHLAGIGDPLPPTEPDAWRHSSSRSTATLGKIP